MNFEYWQKELGLKIILPKKLMNKIKRYIRKHCPKEFGGIFLGYYSEDGKTSHISSIGIPSSYDNSPVIFTRHVENLNQAIKEAYEESNGKIIYLGEWHSHPNNSSSFSQTDYRAMRSIAHDSKVKVETPILMILGVKDFKVTPTFYVFYNEKLYNYEQS